MGVRAMRAAGLTAIVAAALGCAAAGPASAAQFTIDSHASSIGPIVTDAAGNGYIAWERAGSGASIPMFCKLSPAATKCAHPVTLALPGGTQSDANSALALFPILGPGKVVWIVTDRYIQDDTVIWTSTDGGASFGAPHDIPSGEQCKVGAPCEDSVPYTGLLGLDDTQPITNNGDTYNGQSVIDGVGQPTVAFLQSSHDPGLGWDWDATDVVDQYEPGVSEFTFSNAASFVDIVDSALGTTATGDVVEAYTSDGPPNDAVQYFSYTPSAAHPSVLDATQAGWTGPVSFADSYAPRLADGRSGLFMLSASDPTGKPQSIDLRKWNANTHSFAAPRRIAGISSAYDGQGGGLGENYDTGELAAVWPTATASGSGLMSLHVSTGGGTHLSPAEDIATVADSYAGFGTARVAIADNGTGFVTFQDARGLEVADLEPIAAQYSGVHSTGKTLAIPVTCSAPKHPCTAKLLLKLKRVTIGQSFSIGAGVTRTLKLKFTRAALKALKHGHPRGTLTLKLSSHGTSLYRLILHPKL